MTFWPEPDDLSFGAGPHELILAAWHRLDMCFDGPRWLRARFDPGDFNGCIPGVKVVPRRAAVGTPTITTVGLVQVVPGRVESDVVCRIDLPSSWFALPADGVMGMRMLAAGLHALAGIGETLQIGWPPLRSSSRWVGELRSSFDENRFGPLTDEQSMRIIIDAYRRLPRGGLLAAAHRDVSPARQRRQAAIAERLGATEVQDPNPGKMIIWTAPTWPNPS